MSESIQDAYKFLSSDYKGKHTLKQAKTALDLPLWCCGTLLVWEKLTVKLAQKLSENGSKTAWLLSSAKDG